MSWRGIFRDLAAAARRGAREQHRKHQELLKRQQHAEKELLKRQQHVAKLGAAQRAAHEAAVAAQRAAHEVELHENFIDRITSIHRDCGDVWNWSSVKNAPPQKPEYSEEWKTLQRIAAGVLAGQVSAFKEALDELKPFDDIKEIGRNVQMHFTSRYVEASVRLHGPDIVPREIKTLLKTGTVSKKPASETYRHQTYQRHVCSCVLRTASELFAVLPFQKVFVHGLTDLLNPQTGSKEPQVIISVLIPRSTYATLNLDSVDPVDCMRNFVHQMVFSKLMGFSPVNRLNPIDYESTPPPNPSGTVR